MEGWVSMEWMQKSRIGGEGCITERGRDKFFPEKIKKVLTIFLIAYIMTIVSFAGVAELADAQASGACGSNIVWVQVPSPAS